VRNRWGTRRTLGRTGRRQVRFSLLCKLQIRSLIERDKPRDQRRSSSSAAADRHCCFYGNRCGKVSGLRSPDRGWPRRNCFCRECRPNDVSTHPYLHTTIHDQKGCSLFTPSGTAHISGDCDRRNGLCFRHVLMCFLFPSWLTLAWRWRRCLFLFW
jgi:hypothetical protein